MPLHIDKQGNIQEQGDALWKAVADLAQFTLIGENHATSAQHDLTGMIKDRLDAFSDANQTTGHLWVKALIKCGKIAVFYTNLSCREARYVRHNHYLNPLFI